jgi:hypothetical protein
MLGGKSLTKTTVDGESLTTYNSHKIDEIWSFCLISHGHFLKFVFRRSIATHLNFHLTRSLETPSLDHVRPWNQ